MKYTYLIRIIIIQIMIKSRTKNLKVLTIRVVRLKKRDPHCPLAKDIKRLTVHFSYHYFCIREYRRTQVLGLKIKELERL